MRIPRPQRNIDSGDTMTPMIDVVFLLLVFFICASVGGTADHLLPAVLKGSSEPAAEVQPVDQTDDWEPPAIHIRIRPAESGMQILLNEQPLEDTDELTDRLTQLAAVDTESRIILSIHDEIQVQQFVSVYDLCQSLKFQNISFAVSAPR